MVDHRKDDRERLRRRITRAWRAEVEPPPEKERGALAWFARYTGLRARSVRRWFEPGGTWPRPPVMRHLERLEEQHGLGELEEVG